MCPSVFLRELLASCTRKCSLYSSVLLTFFPLFFALFPTLKQRNTWITFALMEAKMPKCILKMLPGSHGFSSLAPAAANLLSVCRVSFLRWFWEPCNYVSVMRERVRVGLLWHRLQLLLTKRETSKESHACSWHRCYSGIMQVLIGGNLSGPGKCVFKTMAVVFWQRPCTATCSTTRWSTSSLPSAGWTTSWWGSCHYAAQSDCGTPTRYTHTHTHAHAHLTV